MKLNQNPCWPSRLLIAIVLVAFQASVQADTTEQRSFPSFSRSSDASLDEAKKYPLHWSPDSVRWQTPLAGYGQSCPAIFGNKSFVTSVAGASKESQIVECIDLDFGKKLWEHILVSSFPVESSPMVSRAAPTPIIDGEGVYAFFESGDLIALDHAGKSKWQRALQQEFGEFVNKFGLSATPVQTAKHLYVLLDHSGESFLLCLEKATGATNWQATRGKRAHSWSSPAVIQFEGQPVIVCSSVGSLDAYSSSDGKLLCSFSKVGGNSVATPYDLGNGRFLVSSLVRPADGPSENALVSNLSAKLVRVGQKVDFQIEWIAEDARGSFCSPVEHAGFTYFLNPQGVLFCLDSKTGKQHYAKRTSSGACWATPFPVGDRLYLFGKEGDTTVVKIGPEF
jgi:outer membrane protein assembly factor BamB